MKTAEQQQVLISEPDVVQRINELPERQELAPKTPMDLLSLALSNGAAIDVIERLAALQEKALARDSEMQFNEAMNAAQAEIGRIAPDLTNKQTSSKYASYPKLDRILRPIYIRHGFSLSFNTGDSLPETVKVICYVSHKAGHTRTYQTLMPADGKGAKGGDVMTKTHATGSAMQYGMRYLVKFIFNIAVGQDDDDGNAAGGEKAQPLSEDIVVQRLDAISAAANDQELKDFYMAALKEAQGAKDEAAQSTYTKAKNQRYRELHAKGGK